MSDELRAWLEQVRDERNQAQVALQNGDDGPMRLWALRHGHVLIDKCEELAGALYYAGDLLASDPDAMKSAWSDHPADIEHFDWVRDQIASALRAPGGGS